MKTSSLVQWWARHRPTAFQVAVTYSAAAALWILGFDYILIPLLGRSYQFEFIHLANHVLFVALSGGVLYIAVRETQRVMQRSQASLAASEERFRTLVNSMDDIVFTLDRQQRHTGVYGRWLKTYNLKPEFFLGKTPRTVLGAAAAPVHEQANEQALTGRQVAYEWSFAGPTGTVHMQTSVSPLHAADGRVVGAVGVGRDVTGYKNLETALRQSNELLQALVSASPLAIVALDADGKVQVWNRAAERMFGWQEAEVLHQPPPFNITEAELGGQCSMRRQRRDGSAIDILISLASLQTDQGRTSGHVALIADITSQRQDEVTRNLLHEIYRRILFADRPTPPLPYLCAELAHLYDCPLVWISTRQVHGHLEVATSNGQGAAYLQQLAFRWDLPAAGAEPEAQAVRTGQPQFGAVSDCTAETPWRDQALAHGLLSYLALPLVAEDENIGVLCLYGARLDTFDDATVRHLAHFAGEVALAVVVNRRQAQIHLQTVALEAMPDGVMITDYDGRIEWVNPGFTRITGHSAQEAVGQTPRILRSGKHTDAFYQNLWQTVRSGQTWRGELYNKRKDGSIYTEQETIASVHDTGGGISHFVAIKQDISQRKEQEARIQHLATHDSLTDLPNLRALEAALGRVVPQARRGRVGALLLLDLDNFKAVNNTAGHGVGDELLALLAGKLQHLLRRGDLLARVGGDEFAVLLEGTTFEDARSVAVRLCQYIDESRHKVGGHTFDLTGSVGLVPIDGSLEPAELLALVHAALQTAKRQGKNRIAVLRSPDEPGAQDGEVHWVPRIKAALADGRMTLYYQPVVDLRSGEAVYFEALLRLCDEEGQLVPAGAFVPVAERFGLMPRVDRWLIETALAELQARPDLHLFLNLSGVSFTDDGLLEFIETAIAQSGVAPHRLGFEVTETAAVSDVGCTLTFMHKLKEMGCLFALDDFGMGFCSFAYLRTLPADLIKLDGLFTRDLDTDATNRALVQAITMVAHTLGKAVIAECVDRAEVAAVLSEIGVEYGQGYLWGRPQPLSPGAQPSAPAR